MFWQNKHREAGEQAFFFFHHLEVPGGGPRNIWLRHDTGNEVPWGARRQRVPGGVFWFLSLHSLALVRLPFSTFFSLVKTTWHQPALEDEPGFSRGGGGVQTKGTTRRLGYGGG